MQEPQLHSNSTLRFASAKKNLDIEKMLIEEEKRSIEQQKNDIAQKNDELAEKEEELNKLEEALKKMQSEGSNSAALEAKEQEIENIHQKLEQDKQNIEKLEKTLAEKQTTLKQDEQKLESLRVELDAAKQALDKERAEMYKAAKELQEEKHKLAQERAALEAEKTYKHGLELEKQGKLPEAFAAYQTAHQHGFFKAATNMATFFQQGTGGVAKDKKRAYELLKLAAEKGHVRAQYNLGYMLYKDDGIPQDTTEALKWFDAAASQKDSAAIKKAHEIRANLPKPAARNV